MFDRVDQQVDAFLFPHHADIADHMRTAVFPVRGRINALQFRQIGAGSHHVHPFGRHPAALDRDLAVGMVGGNRNIRRLEGQLFEQHHQLPKEPALVELGFVKLRIDVVVIEDVTHAQKFERQRDKEDQIGRVAALDHVDPALEMDLPRQHRLPEQCRAIFSQKPDRALRLQRQRVAVDVDAFDHFEAGFIPLAGGADDRHVCTSCLQRAGFLPHPPVKRQGQVFDHDQHVAALQRLTGNDRRDTFLGADTGG